MGILAASLPGPPHDWVAWDLVDVSPPSKPEPDWLDRWLDQIERKDCPQEQPQGPSILT